MVIEIMPHPGMVLINWREPSGKRCIKFVRGNNFRETFEIPDGSVLIDPLGNDVTIEERRKA